ncbi:M20/M25/M40 family metallo-hydrolase [Escherichia coli]|uniref:M20/M25/M40 family metallo-hydrolase n=1 Tax=Escherichia coli TaxID=562 RepID=UPI003B42850C
MDALDLSEEQDVSHRPYRDGFASCNAGMMHACGHDGHTAIGLGLVLPFNYSTSDFPASIKLFFRPPKEGPAGGRRSMKVASMMMIIFLPPVSLVPDLPAAPWAAAMIILLPPTNLTTPSPGPPPPPGENPKPVQNPFWGPANQPFPPCQPPPHRKGLPS